jgi:hypothetical protein
MPSFEKLCRMANDSRESPAIIGRRKGYTVTKTVDESSYDKELRQAALKVFGTSGGINELFKLRSRMLQEISGAILAAYIEKTGAHHHRQSPL